MIGYLFVIDNRNGCYIFMIYFQHQFLVKKELQRKREEKRTENQRVAEEEVTYLQASGKLSKKPAHSKTTAKGNC